MPSAVSPPPTFAVACACGATARGPRTARSQVVPCPGCAKPLFVFPIPPLPPDLVGRGAPGTAPEHAALRLPPRVRFWLVPAAAALLALAAVGVVIASIVRSHRAGAEPALTEGKARELLDARLEAANAALGEGAYRTACQDLDAARGLHGRFPRLLEPDQLRRLARRVRQAALPADLLPEALGEIMRHALGQSDREWQAVFRERYAGRAVVLDARVYRDAAGRFLIDYQLDASGLAGEWDVQALQIFQRLPLAQPQRLLFGVRLADVGRTARDRWAVRPLPDSGL